MKWSKHYKGHTGYSLSLNNRWLLFQTKEVKSIFKLITLYGLGEINSNTLFKDKDGVGVENVQIGQNLIEAFRKLLEL